MQQLDRTVNVKIGQTLVKKRSRAAFRRDGGAALIVAIGILTILLIIGLTFFQMAQREMTVATNTGNQMRAELMAEGATAVAIAFLNHDLAIHPSYTSLDHAWRTYFNGAWAVGKAWTWQDVDADGIVDPIVPVQVLPPPEPPVLGLPMVNLPFIVIPVIDPDNDAGTPNDEPLFTGVTTADSLYYPRIDDIDPNLPNLVTWLDAQTPANLALNHRFVVATNSAAGDAGDSPAIPGVPANPNLEFRPNQIALWTDVDNDGDGLNDSIWIPIAADQIIILDDDGRDNDDDGVTDEPGEDDGIDNNLNNFVWFNDGLDNDGDGIVDEFEEGVDELQGEVKVFLYNGALDGLDNDGDGAIDEPDEDNIFLTAQLFYQRTPADARIEVFDLVGLGVYSGGPPVILDVLDNDYNLVIGNNEVFVIDPTQPESPDNPITIARAHYFLGNQDDLGGFLTLAMEDELGPNEEVWGSAEPVSDIVGRMAILITDESSKVNVNATGGYTYNDFPFGPGDIPGNPQITLTRSMSLGIDTREYDTRVLGSVAPNDMDADRARWTWQLRMGAPEGFYEAALPYYNVNLEADVKTPGLGFVDDNGNALWMALDGIDNDGNGFIDDGLIPHDYDFNPGTPDTLADKLEGIDEPLEYQLFRPLRNPIAEGGLGDNDDDGVIDERGELADKVLKTHEQVKLVDNPPLGIGLTRFAALDNQITVHSNDRNNRYRHSTDGVNLLAHRNRPLTGLKLDYNYAMAEDIAKMLREDFGFVPAVPMITIVPPVQTTNVLIRSFALGLRQEDTDVVSDDPDAPGFLFLGLLRSTAFPADPELRAAQLAATTKDYRDRDHARTEVTTKTDDTWWVDPNGPDPGGTARDISYTSAGVESVRINEIMVRPVRRIEAEMDPIANPVAVGADPLLNPNGFVPQPAFPAPDFLLGVTQVGAAWSLYAVGPQAVIGFGTTYSATALTTAGGQYLAVPPVPLVPDVPNVIQFEFVPTTEMPEGRYYLTVNTQFVDSEGRRITTALRPGDIEFTTKYVGTGDINGNVFVGSAAVNPIRVNPTSIVEDVINGVDNNDLTLVEDVWKPAIIGFGNMDRKAEGTESGWVFFPTDPVRVPLGAVGSTVFDGYFQNEGYTVELLPASSGVVLQVGIRIGAGALAAGRLDINFFDFSQEPDHEWVELVNIAEGPDPVDVSGWKLVVEGPRRTVMTIPDQTFIAPNGYLLLGMNKFDTFATGVPNVNGILYENGIGLARSDGALAAIVPFNALEEVTVPPIGDLGDNIFERSDEFDYTDNDGNGVDAATPNEDGVESTLTVPGFPAGATKPWDRIVELQVSELRGITGPEALANIILSGGIFPNYPEHDFIDNDGDNEILNEDGIDNDGDGVVDEKIASNGVDDNGNNAAWITDGIDNDDDGFIDEHPQSDGIDNNLDGIIDESGEVDPLMGPDEGIDEPGETDAQGTLDDGIDEGRWERPPVLASPPSPPLLTNARAPGSFSDLLIPYVTGSPAVTFDPEYIGGDRDPVEWKAFVERRWYPGDNVIITLYEAAPFQGGMDRVVDRVTYTERDVVNRSVDDILSTDIGGTTALDRVPLHPDFAWYWPDDTMGIDFYKSLERKHPLYAGDRFGTQNRWQATDGNYDDWTDRTSEWELDTQVDDSVFPPIITVPDPPIDREPNPLFNHAFSGSPLRMNLSQRYIENRNGQFNSDDTGTAETYANSVRWAFEDDATGQPRARVRDRDLVSPANLLGAPHFRQELDLDREQADGQLTINESLFDVDLPIPTRFHQDISPEEGLMGQRELITAIPAAASTVTDTRVVTALIGAGAASAPLVLTTGQAEVIPFTPDPIDPAKYSWAPLFTVPEGWAPVLLYDLTGDGAPPDGTFPGAVDYERRYLLNQPGTLPATVTAARSPVATRAVMYVSGNIVGFLQSSPHTAANGAESFFLWDGEDGLENGEYDLYLSLGDDLSTFETDPADTLLTGFGDSFIATAAATLPEQMEVDVEVFTDRNRDGRVYTGGVPLVALTQLDATESFGEQHGLAPGPDGYVRYGMVRVENNVLGVMLRNRTPEGNMIRFSRVILTPRDRTPGRININTTITRDTDGAGGANFNSLMGLPGILAPPGDADPVTAGNSIHNTPVPGLPAANIEGLTRQIALHREIGILNPPVLPGDPGAPADGRYYQFVSDLGSHRYGDNPSNAAEFDSALTSEALNTSAPDVFDEMKARLERMQNLVTVRSDVFEILVTVQAGYGVDVNGDGIINYREQGIDDPEFVVTAERTARTIYER